MTNNERKLVLPGDVVGDERTQPGTGTQRVGNRVVAVTSGILQEQGERVHILPLKGSYDPRPGDQLVGIVTEANTGNWLVDIRAPWPAPMHVSEVPWRVDFGETTNYLKVGDAILCKVLFVDDQKKLQVTLKDRNLSKLEGGELIEVPPMLVARIIGKNGAMVNLIKSYVEVWMLVGQNGRIWLNGEPKEVLAARKVLDTILAHAHQPGLTERIQGMLEEMRPGGVDAGIRVERATQRNEEGAEGATPAGEGDAPEGDAKSGNDDSKEDE